jgi:hypothetical protein
VRKRILFAAEALLTCLGLTFVGIASLLLLLILLLLSDFLPRKLGSIRAVELLEKHAGYTVPASAEFVYAVSFWEGEFRSACIVFELDEASFEQLGKQFSQQGVERNPFIEKGCTKYRKRFIPQRLASFRSLKPITLHSSGGSIDIIYVDDVSRRAMFEVLINY